MFKTENHLPEIQVTMDNFYLDFQPETYIDGDRFEYADAISEHKKLFLTLLECRDESEAQEKTEEFVYFCVTHDIPFMFVYSELLTIYRSLIRTLSQEEDLENIKKLDHYFDELEMQITEAYFHKFLRRLATKNHLRLSHITNLIEKNMMIHYQHHIEWMIQLINYIENYEDEYPSPEMNPRNCSFGKWLHTMSIRSIASTNFQEVNRLHESLHTLALDVVLQCQNRTQTARTLIHLMQRINYISLEIGNEIAIIHDMLMIEEYSKDPLTGLLTRRLFEKIISTQIEIAKATETQCSIMMCDLDYFKKINDTYGHLAGDQVIQNFSEILRTVLRKSDFMFRFGGEEFIIILPSTSQTNARKIAQKICDYTATQEVLFETTPLHYTVSIGVIAINTDSTNCILKETISRYVAEVDAKLYLAKKNGRNRVE
ncbi:MAG: sensor domain-containing diguanylate cyclase [Campylobacterales bacterium]|jgi:diguanylate cyclase (GGDEF)-like protein|nr:sensor domain-containing diguanylate cyclase [Campylobacterales bacterium]